MNQNDLLKLVIDTQFVARIKRRTQHLVFLGCPKTSNMFTKRKYAIFKGAFFTKENINKLELDYLNVDYLYNVGGRRADAAYFADKRASDIEKLRPFFTSEIIESPQMESRTIQL